MYLSIHLITYVCARVYPLLSQMGLRENLSGFQSVVVLLDSEKLEEKLNRKN